MSNNPFEMLGRNVIVRLTKLGVGNNTPEKIIQRMGMKQFSESGHNVRTEQLLHRKKVRTVDIGILKMKQKPITMVSVCDYPSALHADFTGFDVILVGDSLGMVELGMDTTISVTLDDMVHHCKAVVRGAQRSLIIADMPFGSCEGDANEALKNSQRLLKEGGADGVKIEGGRDRAETIKKIVQGGIAVMGHVGLRPQHISVLGGFRAQGQTALQAEEIIEDALAVQGAGAFAVVLECVPSVVAQAVTEILDIPTIGSGAGPHTSGQSLVYHDILGMLQHTHHKQHIPKFCKRYADVSGTICAGLEAYRDDVENGRFPCEKYSPYKMLQEETDELLRIVENKYVRKQPSKEDGKERKMESKPENNVAKTR